MSSVAQVDSIEGLNKALRKLPKAASNELRSAAYHIAQGVASEARGRAERMGSTARHVAPSIRAHRDRIPKISLGRHSPAAFGAEFGGQRRERTTAGGSTMQFEPWRGSDTGAGYFLWPTIRDQRERIRDAYSKALLDALKVIR